MQLHRGRIRRRNLLRYPVASTNALVLAFVLTAMSSTADSKAAPSTSVVLCSGLTLDALADPRYPALHTAARGGALAVVAMPVTVARDEASAVLSMASGQAAQACPGDSQLYDNGEVVEGDPAGLVLHRRTGADLPDLPCYVVHLGIASLQRRRLAEVLVGAVSPPRALGADILPAAGNQSRLAGLLAVDETGIAPCGDNASAVRVVHVGTDLGLAEEYAAAAIRQRTRLWILGTRAPGHGNEFAVRPTLAILWGPGIPRGVLLSRTTRTAGLISFADVKPTLLSWVKGGTASTFHSVEVRAEEHAASVVGRWDRLAQSNIGAMVPVLLASGLVLAVSGTMALWAMAGRQQLAGPALLLLRLCMTLPLVFLFAGWVVSVTPFSIPAWLYGTLVAVTACLSSWLVAMSARLLRCSQVWPPELCVFLATTCLVIVLDGVTGQHLLKMSLLAACGMGGIRFYGVGNEYMGILVGASLGLLYMAGARRRAFGLAGLALAAFFGLGVFGANAGGVVTAVGACACEVQRNRVSRWQARWFVGSALLGVAAAFAFATLDASLFGPAASHLGGSLQNARMQGIHLLAEIATRKLLMNLSILVTWPAVLALAIVIGFVVVIALHGRQHIVALEARYPWWLQWRPVALYASIIAFLFNDTGTVAGMFVFGVWVIVGLYLDLRAPAESNANQAQTEGLVE